MSKRFRIVAGGLLSLVGVGLLGYAIAGVLDVRSNLDQANGGVGSGSATNNNRVRRDGADSQGDADRPPSRGIANTPADAEADLPDGARLWLTGTLLLALPAIFFLFVLGVSLIRRLRPKGSCRHGPTDTTDLWREAGRRFRLDQ